MEFLPKSIVCLREGYTRESLVRDLIAGVVVGIVHWLTHIEAFGPEQPPLWLDLVAGYPMAAVLLIAGGIVAGEK